MSNTTNLELMKKKLEALRNPTNGGGKKNFFWKPEVGESIVRIVPTPDGDPFKELHFHYNIGKENGFLCPKRNFGDDCPVCGFATQLYKSGDEANMKIAKGMFVRQRFFSFVLVRGKEDEGIKLWGYGKRVYEKLLNYTLDPDYGDLADVEGGFDIKVTVTKTAGADYPTTDVIVRPKPCVMCEEPSAVLESLPDFAATFDRKTSVQVQEILDKALAESTDDPEAASNETEHFAAATTNESPAPATAEDIDSAFAELKGKSKKSK